MNGVLMTCTSSLDWPCAQCLQRKPIASPGWSHGFGWANCPECTAASAPPKKPQRAEVLDLHVEGDTREAVVSLLIEMANSIRNGSNHSTTGGYDCGGHYTFTRNPEQTHEKYVADLEAYLTATGQRE